MITVRCVDLADPLARANVMRLLGGPGGPAGVRRVHVDGTVVHVAFDDAHTPRALIEALIAVATDFVPERAGLPPDRATAAAIAACGLDEPDLDATRIIESYLT